MSHLCSQRHYCLRHVCLLWPPSVSVRTPHSSENDATDIALQYCRKGVIWTALIMICSPSYQFWEKVTGKHCQFSVSHFFMYSLLPTSVLLVPIFLTDRAWPNWSVKMLLRFCPFNPKHIMQLWKRKKKSNFSAEFPIP